MADDPKLVVALEARLNKFEKDLQQAGVIADREVKKIEDRFQRSNPQFKATFLGSFMGNLAGQLGSGVMRFLEELPEKFEAVAKAADFAGISIERAFSMGKAAGNIEATAKSLEQLAILLDRAHRGEENGLAKLFGANDIDVKNIKTVEQAWLVIADLVRNAKNPVQEAEVLKLAGVSQELAEHFRKGADEVGRLQAEARKAEPELTRLANIANVFQTQWRESIDNIQKWFLDMLARVAENIAPIARALAEWMKIHAQHKVVADAFEGAAQAWERMANPRTRVVVHGSGTTRLPDLGGGGSDTNAFERAETQIERRRQLLEAETATIGQNEAARQRLRVETELLNAAERAQLEMTPELRARIDALADAYARTAERAEMARNIMSGTREFGSALADAFKAATLEGQKLDEVLKNLLNRLSGRAIDALFNMAFQALGSSLAGSLAGPGGGVLPGGLPLGMGGIGHNAAGTNFWRGGPTWVGENGPEIVDVPRGSQIIPSDAARSMGPSVNLSLSNVIDARGADLGVEARLRAALSASEQRVIRTVKQSLPTWSDRQARLGKI